MVYDLRIIIILLLLLIRLLLKVNFNCFRRRPNATVVKYCETVALIKWLHFIVYFPVAL